ncbi:MAG: hypothetical protein V4850_29815 [Myxococcota bacterium]
MSGLIATLASALLATVLPAAHAADDDGAVFTTRLHTSIGTVRPTIRLGLSEPPQPDLGDSEPPQPDHADSEPPQPDHADSEPPQPDLESDGRVATATLRSAHDGTFTASVALAEEAVGIASIVYRDHERAIVLYGDGAVDRFLPPDPYLTLDVRLRDGTAFEVAVELASPDGDLGGLVGYAVRGGVAGFPAALELDVDVAGRDGATLALSVAVSAGGKALGLD